MSIDILKLDAIFQKTLQLAANEPISEQPPQLAYCTAWYLSMTAAIHHRNNILQQERVYDLDFYFLETGPLLDQYVQELRRPTRWVFGQKNSLINKNKKNLIRIFLDTVSKLYLSDLVHQRFDGIAVEKTSPELLCHCGSTSFATDPDADLILCQECGTRVEHYVGKSFSFQDSKRANITQRTTNEKRSHFINCFNQYAGAQKVDIPASIISLIDASLERYKLINTKAATRAERYARVTKEHIKLILQDLGHYRTYSEYLMLIYRNIVGQAIDQLAGLRSVIIQDFDKFNDLYQKRYFDKKPYNYQQLLFQLLRRHGHICDLCDFNFLKTTERKIYHEEKQKQIFIELGWNYISLF